MPGYVHRERVRFGDLDALRHLNNVVFLRYYESARIDYIRSFSPRHSPLDEGAFGLIFAECHINYRAPVHLDDEIEVRCSVAEVKRSSFRVPFEMRVGERVCAEGYGVLVGFDYAAQRAAPLPATLLESLEREASAGTP
jgi:acyl-CoA thioester hydrolase